MAWRPWKRLPLRRFAFRPTLEPLERRVLPATFIWSGFGTDQNFSDGANWQGGTPPSGGDDLQFPAGANQSVAVNDFAANTTFNSIQFTGGGYLLKGNAVVLNAGIVNASAGGADSVQFNGITLATSQLFQAGPSGCLAVSSPVATNGNALILDGNNATQGSSLTGAIGGSGGIIKNGAGNWLVSGNSTYDGLTSVTQGKLVVTSPAALGSTVSGTLVKTGASLSFVGAVTPVNVAEPLALNGAGTGGSGALDLSGAVLNGRVDLGSATTITGSSVFSSIRGTLNTNNFDLTLAGSVQVGILGPVTGAGALNFTGQLLSGTTTIPGVVNMNSGALSPGVLGTQPGLLTTGGANLAGGTTFRAVLNSTVPGQFSELDATGNVNLNGATLSVALNFQTAPGDSFPIVSSAAAITGTFNGLPEGATVVVNGQKLVIHYVTRTSSGHLQPSSQVILENPLNSSGTSAGTPFKPLLPGENVFATAADAGGGPDVKVYDAASGAALFNFFAYDPKFTGGVRIAIDDVNGDGVFDIVTAAGPGGGPNVTVFNGKTGRTLDGPLGSFFAFDTRFTGGLYVAAGDVNGDGFADIICGADAGGGPNVTVFSGKDGSRLMSFFPYDIHFTGGVRVAAGDVDGDGRADIVCGAGPGGGPNVTVVSGRDGSAIRSFFAFAPAFSAGIYVATGDLNGDGKADVIVGAGPGGGPNVTGISGADSAVLLSFFPYDPGFTGGVRVAAVDRDGDGRADVVTVAGPGGGPDVRTTSVLTLQQLDDFFAYDPRFSGGLYVAGTAK